MSTLDIRYTAGLFDGEGHVTIHRSKHATKAALYLTVGISNKNLQVLRLLVPRFGGYISKKKDGVCEWLVHSVKALRFLEAVYPYLHIKSCVAWIGICYQRHLVAFRKYADQIGLMPSLRLLTDGECELREAAKKTVSEINRLT